MSEGCIAHPLTHGEILSCRTEHLVAVLFCNYGEGRSKELAEKLAIEGVRGIAYLHGGLNELSTSQDNLILAACLTSINHRIAILTPGEIRHNFRLIATIQPSIHKNIDSAYSYLKGKI